MAPGTPGAPTAECVVNISDGRDTHAVTEIAAAAGGLLLDVHTDPVHHRSVLTLAGPLDDLVNAARGVALAAVSRIDLTKHTGVHPRMGAVDVVPFVPLVGDQDTGTQWDRVLLARNAFAEWAGSELSIPCFLYGPERSLPDVRRGAFNGLQPDTGPSVPHPTAGSTAVGARPVLIAYNVWIDGPTPDRAERTAGQVAARLRRPGLRTLGLPFGSGAQVSCNIVDPGRITLTEVYDTVVGHAAALGCTVRRGELVGLLPDSAFSAVPPARRSELGLRPEDTIESRLVARMP